MNSDNFTLDELVSISVAFELRAKRSLADAIKAETDGDEWRVSHYLDDMAQALGIANKANRKLRISEVELTR